LRVCQKMQLHFLGWTASLTLQAIFRQGFEGAI